MVTMNGQWKGRIAGDPNGTVVFDIDQSDGDYKGAACLFPDDQNIPNTLVIFERFTHNISNQEFPIFPLDHTGNIIGYDRLSKVFPGTYHSNTARISVELQEGRLTVSYSTNINTHGKGILAPSAAGKRSKLIADPSIQDWATFKNYVNSNFYKKHGRWIFRGQDTCQRLRTSFHRTNRKDLYQYIMDDIPRLRRILSPSLQHYFSIEDPLQLGAFYNLIQHHGYPTPLLDWTLSPYIAAFFAFHTATSKKSDKVRIFQFNSELWRAREPQIPYIANVRPHFSIVELLGMENPRMIPQQASATLTNIDDIESYLLDIEQQFKITLLKVIDLPISEKSIALQDLSLMGINEATIYPGLESSCRSLRRETFV